MNKKRDRIQVIHDILESIKLKNGKIKPTHIMYKSNLSHKMMDIYLKELISKNFIVELQTKQGRTYSLTDKGFNFLSKYNVILEFMDSFGLN
ncbi:MAG: winged helix-turn-helix domain-containing protein [archaeon]